jgi:branched-chain amino acid aminotransferase
MGRVNRLVYLNGEIIGEPNARIAVLASAVFYGKGIFTTITIVDSSPFLWNKHLLRLTSNAEKVGIDLSEYPDDAIRKALDDIIAANAVVNGRARVTLFDETASSFWCAEAGGGTGLSLVTGEPRPLPENFRLGVSPYRVNSGSPLATVKSCNYLENILAIEDAKRRGFDEAIRANERSTVTSACMANVFWLKDGRLSTPALSTGCLPGTTREFVLENVECDEVEDGIGEIESADAVFLTSAGLGVIAVYEFNGRILAPNDHRILRLIEESR